MNPPSMLRLRKLKMQPNAVKLNWSTVVATDTKIQRRKKDLFLSSSKNSHLVHKRFDLVEGIMQINVYVLAVGSYRK